MKLRTKYFAKLQLQHSQYLYAILHVDQGMTFYCDLNKKTNKKIYIYKVVTK